MGWDKQVLIRCKVTNTVTLIEDVELVEQFHKTLTDFLDRHDLTIQDFLDYARSRFMCELFDMFIEEMGWKVSQIDLNLAEMSRMVNASRVAVDSIRGGYGMAMQAKIAAASVD
jgi:hypothetical protein